MSRKPAPGCLSAKRRIASPSRCAPVPPLTQHFPSQLRHAAFKIGGNSRFCSGGRGAGDAARSVVSTNRISRFAKRYRRLRVWATTGRSFTGVMMALYASGSCTPSAGALSLRSLVARARLRRCRRWNCSSCSRRESSCAFRYAARHIHPPQVSRDRASRQAIEAPQTGHRVSRTPVECRVGADAPVAPVPGRRQATATRSPRMR